MDYGQQAQNGSYGLKGAASQLPKEMSSLADFINSIDGHIAMAQDLLQRVDKVADRIGGPTPRDATGEVAGQAPEESALNLRLSRKLRTLNSLQNAISTELTRLENAI